MKRWTLRSLLPLLATLLPLHVAVAQDPDLIARAQAGEAEAQTELGYIYAIGEGVEQNFDEALRWLQAGTRQGYADAQYNYGNMFANGFGVEQDFAEALKLKALGCGMGQGYFYGRPIDAESTLAYLNQKYVEVDPDRLAAAG